MKPHEQRAAIRRELDALNSLRDALEASPRPNPDLVAHVQDAIVQLLCADFVVSQQRE